LPSWLVFDLAESGVSGSISPVRIFFNKATFPLLIHRGLSLQGFPDVVYLCTNVL
jgi:hypothetical protein